MWVALPHHHCSSVLLLVPWYVSPSTSSLALVLVALGYNRVWTVEAKSPESRDQSPTEIKSAKMESDEREASQDEQGPIQRSHRIPQCCSPDWTQV